MDVGVCVADVVVQFSDNGGPVQSGATNTPLRAGKGTTFTLVLPLRAAAAALAPSGGAAQSMAAGR